MKSFISSCNINEILYNIDIPGNLNPYTIGNPMYFPVNRFNIFTSIPLVPENDGLNNGWNLPEWAKWTVGSIVIAGIWISVPFTGGSTLPMAIVRVAGNGKHVWRLNASTRYLFHLQWGATRAMQSVHHWILPILMYNGIVNTGLVVNDISDYFFGY